MQSMITLCLKKGRFTTVNKMFAQYLKRMKTRYKRFLGRLSGRDSDEEDKSSREVINEGTSHGNNEDLPSKITR